MLIFRSDIGFIFEYLHPLTPQVFTFKADLIDELIFFCKFLHVFFLFSQEFFFDTGYMPILMTMFSKTVLKVLIHEQFEHLGANTCFHVA